MEINDTKEQQTTQKNESQKKSYQKKFRTSSGFPDKTVIHRFLNHFARGKRERNADQHSENPAVVLLNQ
jgi:hypothetical protein